MKTVILWGFHPSYSKLPLKIGKYSAAEFKRREKEGWALEVCEEGERPTYLFSLITP
jgi:hypothetical protein